MSLAPTFMRRRLAHMAALTVPIFTKGPDQDAADWQLTCDDLASLKCEVYLMQRMQMAANRELQTELQALRRGEIADAISLDRIDAIQRGHAREFAVQLKSIRDYLESLRCTIRTDRL